MAFKDIIVHVDDSSRAAIRYDIALDLVAMHQAHLVALNVRSHANIPAIITAQFGAEVDAMLEQSDAEAAAVAKAMVDGRSAATGVAVEWRDVSGDSTDMVALHGRYSDLVVVGQTEPDDDLARPQPASLILELGRPLLVVPYAGRFPTVGRRVLVAWNGGREAARAVHDALPLLVGAEIVHVVAINPGHARDGLGDIPGGDICCHLSRHGVRSQCESIRSDDLKVGEMLLSRAADENVDLIVMGGYGRSRLREMVLGGATRHLLEHMTAPVLFSH